MTQDIEQFRAGFEAWARHKGWPLDKYEWGEYIPGETQQHWRTWVSAKSEASTEPSSTIQGAAPGDALDAARYRWLTDNPGFIRPHLNGRVVYVNWSGTAQELDKAIDAAIAASTTKGE